MDQNNFNFQNFGSNDGFNFGTSNVLAPIDGGTKDLGFVNSDFNQGGNTVLQQTAGIGDNFNIINQYQTTNNTFSTEGLGQTQDFQNTTSDPNNIFGQTQVTQGTTDFSNFGTNQVNFDNIINSSDNQYIQGGDSNNNIFGTTQTYNTTDNNVIFGGEQTTTTTDLNSLYGTTQTVETNNFFTQNYTTNNDINSYGNFGQTETIQGENQTTTFQTQSNKGNVGWGTTDLNQYGNYPTTGTTYQDTNITQTSPQSYDNLFTTTQTQNIETVQTTYGTSSNTNLTQYVQPTEIPTTYEQSSKHATQNIEITPQDIQQITSTQAITSQSNNQIPQQQIISNTPQVSNINTTQFIQTPSHQIQSFNQPITPQVTQQLQNNMLQNNIPLMSQGLGKRLLDEDFRRGRPKYTDVTANTRRKYLDMKVPSMNVVYNNSALMKFLEGNSQIVNSGVSQNQSQLKIIPIDNTRPGLQKLSRAASYDPNVRGITPLLNKSGLGQIENQNINRLKDFI